MIIINKDNIKKYSFTQQEKQMLQDVEVGLISFHQAVAGMELNKQMILSQAAKRLQIDLEAPEGFERKVNYDLAKNEIVVTDIQKESTIITAKK